MDPATAGDAEVSLKLSRPMPIEITMAASKAEDSASTNAGLTAEHQYLTVGAAGSRWALPMDSVEQVFYVDAHLTRRTGNISIVHFQGEPVEMIGLAERLRLEAGPSSAGVIVWSGGRRRALIVDELIGQVTATQADLPSLAHSAMTSGVIEIDDDLVPVIELSTLLGNRREEDEMSTEPMFSDMQQSALQEVSNIGCGHAATALSTMLAKDVELGVPKASVTGVAKALDSTGSAMSRGAVVTAAIRDGGGAMMLIFPEDAAEELCQLLGTTMADPLGPTALQEVGNILASSYMNAIVEMTGLDIEPEPPTIGIDLLGKLFASTSAAVGDPDAPALLMRSEMTVAGTTARFAFVYVPKADAVDQLLDRLGVQE